MGQKMRSYTMPIQGCSTKLFKLACILQYSKVLTELKTGILIFFPSYLRFIDIVYNFLNIVNMILR